MNSNDDDNSTDFRKAMSDVKPLSAEARVTEQPKPDPSARFTRADAKQVLVESIHGDYDPRELETADDLSYLKDGVRGTVLRRLRRGHFRVEGEIDLHGMTVAVAADALNEFLAHCETQNLRCVRVVHGKGKRSGQRGPVLRNKVNVWLRRRKDVIAFTPARDVDGGTGAVYVLLKHR